MTSFSRLYLECADTYTLHIISDGRHWISSWRLLHDHGSQQLYGLTDHRCFVHLISVEFSEYNIELVDLVDSVTSTQLNCQTIDSIGRLDFTPFSQLDSTPPSNDRLNRSTQSISGSSPVTSYVTRWRNMRNVKTTLLQFRWNNNNTMKNTLLHANFLQIWLK